MSTSMSSTSSSTSAVVVRPFRRSDRDQLTGLVNAHIAAVIPRVAVSVSGLLSQLEREPGEFIVDPWVAERATLVAEQRERIVAAAHLVRYADDERVAAGYRGIGEIRWLVCYPDAPFWQGSIEAGHQLATACVAQLARWQVRACHADGALPAPGVYGVPDQWPHIRQIYQDAGFEHVGDVETVFIARVVDLPRITDLARHARLPQVEGLEVRRTLGINGTRLSAVLDGSVIGYIEVASLDESPRTRHTEDLADIGNLHVDEPYRRRGVGTWLMAQAADWLELGGVTRLLDYGNDTDADPASEAGSGSGYVRFLGSCGFHPLTRTARTFQYRRTSQ
jgi:GNAT superfamily N-acetyltransferase